MASYWLKPTGRAFGSRNVDKKAEIIIFDDIGDSFFGEGITGKSVQAELKAFGDVDEITVRINSPGGAIFDGLAIYNLLHQHPARIIVEIDGLAASAASVIAMAGDEIRMAENALMMVHAASGVVAGNADELRETADLLEKITDNIVAIYAARTGRSLEELSALVDNETWLTASEALDLNLITDITPDKAIAATAVKYLSNRGKSESARLAAALISSADDDEPVPNLFWSKTPITADAITKNTPVHSERKQQTTNQGTQMDIVKALGYENEEQVFSAFADIKTFQNGVVSALGASDPADAVQRLTNMTAELATAKAAVVAEKVKADTIKVDAQVDSLTKDMKLAPAQEGFFRSLNASQREAFVATATPLVAKVHTPKVIEANQVVLTAVQEEMILKTGVDREKYMAQVAADNKKEVS